MQTSPVRETGCSESSASRREGEAAPGGLIWLKGTVAAREFLGEFIRYVVTVGANEIVADQAHYTDARKFEAGDAVDLGIQPEQIRVLPA